MTPPRRPLRSCNSREDREAEDCLYNASGAATAAAEGDTPLRRRRMQQPQRKVNPILGGSKAQRAPELASTESSRSGRVARRTRRGLVVGEQDERHAVGWSDELIQSFFGRFRDGGTVCYTFLGTTLYPMVQPGDVCTFHPIQAVTATGHQKSSLPWTTIQKERSEIGVGDVVFCQWGSSAEERVVFTGVVHEVKQKRPRGSAASDSHQPRPKYLIGDILGHITHWCNREHIFGILFDVQVVTKFCTAGTHTDEDPCGVMVEPTYAGEHTEQFQSSRPLPKTIFEAVSDLTRCSENDLARARNLCLPDDLARARNLCLPVCLLARARNKAGQG